MMTIFLRMKRVIFGVLAGAAMGAVAASPQAVQASNDQSVLAEAVCAYGESDLKEARRLAAQCLDEPTGRLIYYSCLIFDVAAQQLRPGLTGLNGLYHDVAADVQIRADAGLSLARTLQILRMRQMLPGFDDIDIESVYRQVMDWSGHTSRSCFAAMYLAEHYFDGGRHPETEKLFGFIEDFLEKYDGPPQDKVAVHLCADSYYIELKRDYENAFRHIKAAYETGISKALLNREILFRLGRISHAVFHNYPQAAEYYREFLRLYPDANYTPVVNRFLDEIEVDQVR